MNDLPVEAVKAFNKVCSQAARASAEYNMLQPGDRVLAAVSGGLDSLVMLETLVHLQKKVPFKFDLQAITFDPGFPGFNSQGIAGYCKQRQIKHSIIQLDIPALLTPAPDGRFRRPCVRCSRLRRGKLYGASRDLKVNKLALGHHADDLLESFVMSLIRGQGLTTMGPNVLADEANGENGELRIIRPLALLEEKTVKTAAGCFEFPRAGECPYKEELDASGDRAWVKRELARWQERIPDLKTLMLKSMNKVEVEWLLDKRYINTER